MRGKKRQPSSRMDEREHKVARTEGIPTAGQTFLRLDTQTVSYFTEVRTTLDSLEDSEERSLLADNALEEASGREIEVASDPACSRVLEVLLGAASGDAVLKSAQAVLIGDKLLALATNPFGSHVAERLLDVLAQQVEDDGLGTSHAAYRVLEESCQTASSKLYDLITDRFGSHVVRRLLVVAAGNDVTPAQTMHDGAEATRTWKEKGGIKTGLAAKVDVGGRGHSLEAAECRFPELLLPMTEVLLSDEYAGSLAEELPFHPYASPFLQAFLSAQRGNRKALTDVIVKLLGATDGAAKEDGARLEDLPLEHVHGIMQERISSHLLEVVLSVAPEALRVELFDCFFRGYLAQLALHPVANFVVQAALAAVRTTPEMKGVVKELRGSFPELLQRKRAGVVAAALAAAARTGTGQVELSQALAAALRELPGNTQGPVAALLTLDMPSKLDNLDVTRRLSTLGCTMLTSAFKFNKAASSDLFESLLDLSPGELARVAADPGGSRVLEAFLESSANAKLKKKGMKKLQGSYGAIALTQGGNHLVEKCYVYAGMKDKENIAGELAKAEMQLSTMPRGMKLLNRCGVSEYKRNSAAWRNRVQTAAAIAEEFADMLGDEPGGTAASPAAASADAAAEEAAPPAADSRAERKANKAEQKRNREGSIMADLIVGTEEAPKTKKRRKQKQAAGESKLSPMVAGNAASEPVIATEPPIIGDDLPAAKQKQKRRNTMGAKRASHEDTVLKIDAAEELPGIAASQQDDGDAKLDNKSEAAPQGKQKASKKTISAPGTAVEGGISTLARVEDSLKTSDALPALTKAQRKQKQAKKVAGEDSKRSAEVAHEDPQSVAAKVARGESQGEAVLPNTSFQLLDVFEDRSRGTSTGKDGGKSKKKKRSVNGKGGWKGISKGAGKAKKRKGK